MSFQKASNFNLFDYRKDSATATLLDPSDASNVNEYKMTSDVTESHPITIDHNRRLVTDMVDNIFDERKGTCNISSSECSSLKLTTSEYSYDKRLKYWKDVLEQRQHITWKILKQTAKKPSDILYNRLTTVDDRDKQTVKRLMDYADRMSPLKLSIQQRTVLKEKCNYELGLIIPELQETFPKSENLEICGLPEITKNELLGNCKYQGQDKPYNWLKSKYLEKRIEDIREDIERVVEYYPDVEHLQIIGESIKKSELQQHNSEIQILCYEDIDNISSDSKEGIYCVCQGQADINIDAEPSLEYGLKINEQVFTKAKKRISKNLKISQHFNCFPFQTEVKHIMTIQNVGRKVLNFEWINRSFYDTAPTLLKSLDNEFVFDNKPFRLVSGEKYDILVKYQPRRVGIVKSKWILKVQPTLFCSKLDGIVMSLCGNCLPYPEYENKLTELQSEVIDKSNMKIMRDLTLALSTIIPDLAAASKQIYPYQRTLNDLELFEQLNIGYKCERYHDLELLKDLYKRVKKPREKLWDLKVDTLKCMVLRLQEPKNRALYFNELTGILESMKGKCIDLEKRILENPEIQRTRLIYVRGFICASIDEWEDMTITLEEAFLKTSLQGVNNKLKHEEQNNIFSTTQDDEQKRQYILKKRVRKLKPFRDSLYIQTYTLICNFVENIGNIIEGTDFV